jgi:hypothetical protein
VRFAILAVVVLGEFLAGTRHAWAGDSQLQFDLRLALSGKGKPTFLLGARTSDGRLVARADIQRKRSGTGYVSSALPADATAHVGGGEPQSLEVRQAGDGASIRIRGGRVKRRAKGAIFAGGVAIERFTVRAGADGTVTLDRRVLVGPHAGRVTREALDRKGRHTVSSLRRSEKLGRLRH